MKRIDWVDIAKGIGIVLVTLSHTRLKQTPFGEWVSVFFMPLFFFLAGYCFNEAKYPRFKEYVVKKAKGLLYPYVAMSIAVAILLIAFCYDDRVALRQMIHGFWNGYSFVPMWFLTALFLCELLAWWLVRLAQSQLWFGWCCSVIALAVGYLSPSMSFLAYFRWLPHAIFGLSWYWVGWLMRRVSIQKPSAWGVVIVLLLSIGQQCLHPYCYDFADRRMSDPLTYFLGGVSGSLLVVFSSILLARWKVPCVGLSWLGRNTIPLFIMHGACGICCASWHLGSIGHALEYGMLVVVVWLLAGPLKFFTSYNAFISLFRKKSA